MAQWKSVADEPSWLDGPAASAAKAPAPGSTSRLTTVVGTGGDDIITGTANPEIINGGGGFDVISGGGRNDVIYGGAGGDFVYGGGGNDILFGDSGEATVRTSDRAADRLDGGAGNDIIVLGDGNDNVSGGAGADSFQFRFNDPSVALAAGTGRAFTTITDFNAPLDTLRFDVAGVGPDRSGANFVDGGAGDGTPGGRAATFYTGAASGSNGESVMVLTATGFASGADAVARVQGEAEGDLILYFNATVGVASLLVVDGPDAAHSIARFSNIDSLADLQSAGLVAGDFIFG